MKNSLLLLIFTLVSLNVFSQAYSTCSAAASGTKSLASGACLTNQNFPGSANMAGTCVGGSNPAIYIKFTAGSCSQFTVTPNFGLGTSSDIGYAIYTTGCSYVSGSAACVGNTVAGNNFTISGIDFSGTNLLTNGTTYILMMWGAVGSNTMNICYNANTPEAAANECSGALGLGTVNTTYFNGGDCSYSGSYDDKTTSDPSTAAQVCAGSLENTQWVKFVPVAGATSIQVNGSNISCTGGGCGFQFGIFTGTCSSLTYQGCYGNKVCSGGQSTAGPLDATGGYVMTWSNTTSSGFNLTITPSSGTFTGTENFYLLMDGNADADCKYTLVGVNVLPLPVTLISFTGKVTSGKTKLEWVTASERNNDYFNIQRSFDGERFVNVGKVDGAKNSTTINTYSFIDETPNKGINYYRLEQVDFDGTRWYDNVIQVVYESFIPHLLKRVSLLGVEVSETYEGVIIEIYSDNTIKKVIR